MVLVGTRLWYRPSTRKILSCTSSDSLKPDLRAEKSVRSNRRSRRGLRKGRKRARGDKPRCCLPDRQPLANEHGDRKLKRQLRLLDFWKSRVDGYIAAYRKYETKHQPIVQNGNPSDGYDAWKERFFGLRRKALSMNVPKLWHLHSWASFRSFQLGLHPPRGEARNREDSGNPFADFHELVMRVRPFSSAEARKDEDRRVREIDHEPILTVRGKKTVCSHCSGPCFSMKAHKCYREWQNVLARRSRDEKRARRPKRGSPRT